VIPPFGRDLLAIYLNDHLAGATAGLDLARRSRASNEGTELGAYLATLEREIADDRGALLEIMDRLDVGRDRLKLTAGWMAEKLGRLKLNGRIASYSPLSRLLEVEGLLIGLNAKRAAWSALRNLTTREPRLDAAELDRLIARADRQIDELRAHHTTAGARALVERT
jgi:hypothetical protein